MSLTSKNNLETQIQYKMIERLSWLNEKLLEEIENRKVKELQLEEERARLKEALNHKELLLREVNHRVKNNLQIIKSLLSVQVDLSHSNEAADALDAFSGRLDSLVSLHTLLYTSDASGDIPLMSFLKEVFGSVFDESVRLNLDCKEAFIYFEKLSSLGMILHEMATNSCKHAWRAGDSKVIDIEINVIDDVMYVKYRDNGTKLKTLEEIKSGFGLELMNILLSSTIENRRAIDENGGLMYEFSVNLK